MATISLRRLLDDAAEHGYAIPSFNVNFLEQAQAVLEAANEVRSPVILQISTGGLSYAQEWFVSAIKNHAVEAYPSLPICIHRDHAHDLSHIQNAIDLGFDSVMVDGSLMPDGKTPSTYEHNIQITQQAISMAHKKGISVEGELGCLGSLETGLAGDEDGSGSDRALSREEMLTDPDQAKDFVSQTGIDALAIAIGTSHGAYKFKNPPSENTLAISRVQEIHQAIPNQHLVLHGASSVPQDILNQINEFGGNIPKTYGVPIDQIQKAIPFGVRKVNIDTDLRLACTAAIRQHLHQQQDAFDPRHYLSQARLAMKSLCMERYIALGSAGHADSHRWAK